MNTTHPRPRPILLLLSALLGLAISAFAVVSPAKAQPYEPPTVSAILCVAQLVPCSGGPGPELPSGPSTGQPVVSVNLKPSSQECYTRAKLTIDAVNDAVVYVVDPFIAGYYGPDSYDEYHLIGGSRVRLNEALFPQEDMPIVAVAALNNPSVVLYAFRVAVDPCIMPPLPPVEVRPYEVPVISAEVNCGKTATVKLKLESSPNVEPINVYVNQSPLGGPWYQSSWNSVTLGAGLKKAQEIRLPWSVKDAPILVGASDHYGNVLDVRVLVPTKGKCPLGYDPATILLPYGGK